MRLRQEAEMRSRRSHAHQGVVLGKYERQPAGGWRCWLSSAAVGAAIPTSDYENKLMGETRDRSLMRAKERA